MLFFPHTRGWSHLTLPDDDFDRVFPAHAGVILTHMLGWQTMMSFSRTRGGDPAYTTSSPDNETFFPHTRGWSLTIKANEHSFRVFPAHAGVILKLHALCLRKLGFSRTRGGDPTLEIYRWRFKWFFPHTRGWSQVLDTKDIFSLVFPAHAGVIPFPTLQTSHLVGFSRTRGGDPPAHRQMWLQDKFFPHTRGWSSTILVLCYSAQVFPAHAGVILRRFTVVFFQTRFSRTRGGDPEKQPDKEIIELFFPHTRGWSRFPRSRPVTL